MRGNDMLAGGAAGFVATAPMTLAMELMYRLLPSKERYPLPPSLITAQLTKAAGVRHRVDREEHRALTLVNHFGYGTLCGVLYGASAARLAGPGALKGALFGVLVWAVSYLGILPALHILQPATKHPGRRNALMIAAHVVWGVTLGVVGDRWSLTGDR